MREIKYCNKMDIEKPSSQSSADTSKSCVGVFIMLMERKIKVVLEKVFM